MRIQMRKKAAGLRNHEENMALGVIGRPQAYKRSNGIARRTADGGLSEDMLLYIQLRLTRVLQDSCGA